MFCTSTRSWQTWSKTAGEKIKNIAKERFCQENKRDEKIGYL
jgi:hypothetical protein